jgi:hypothetical protein
MEKHPRLLRDSSAIRHVGSKEATAGKFLEKGNASEQAPQAFAKKSSNLPDVCHHFFEMHGKASPIC